MTRAFGEVTDRKTRAELLDEGLDILTGLWRGQPFGYEGKHYKVKEIDHHPPSPPVQQPRIPIWVVGAWPRMKSMRRALRYDGLLPTVKGEDGHERSITLDDVREMKAFVEAHRTETRPFDILIEGKTPGNDRETGAAIVRPWAEAGATWWIEGMWDALDQPHKRKDICGRIQQRPPRWE